MFSFKTQPADQNFKPKLLIYGDMGNTNGRAVASLEEEIQSSTIDAVLHVGDFAYDMADVSSRLDPFDLQLLIRRNRRRLRCGDLA